jgi:parvulin-like peptidyl-prolyl isomerase
LAQKLSFLIEDLAAVEEPGDDELRRFYGTRSDAYVQPARMSFRHVFFSRDRRADASAEAGAALATLRLTAAGGGIATTLGDPFMLHSEYAGRSHQEVRELFGPEFADSVFALQGDSWQGPVKSSYGEHLVLILGREDARTPPFEEVREAVLRDFQQERREEANTEAYREMRARYEVEVEEAPPDREARQ